MFNPRRLTLLALVLPLVVASGCTAAGREIRSPFAPPAQRNEQGDELQRIRISNLGSRDATVFALVGGRRIRIGIVNAVQDKDFEFPIQGGANSVRFELDFFAGPTCLTEQVQIDRGGIIQLNLPATPENTIGCRRR